MVQMTNSQARVVDPILTSVAKGYKNAKMIGHELFPSVPVSARGGKIIQFDRRSFKLYKTARSPGSDTPRIQFGYQGVPYALEDDSLEAVVPVEQEEESATIGINDAIIAVNGVQEILALGNEYKKAQLARNLANYPSSNKVTLSGTGQWSDYTGTSDPSENIKTGRKAIRSATGQYPNLVVLSPDAFFAAENHPKIIERVKYTGRDSVTEEILAKLWKVDKVVVGLASFDSDDGVTSDVWGKDVILAFTQTASMASRGLPSFGYTYQLSKYPFVEMPYSERNQKSMIYPVNDCNGVFITCAEAGYLIKNAVS